MKIPTVLLVFLIAQIGWQGSEKLPRPPDVSEAMVDSLAAEYYEAKLTFYPALATLKGIAGYNDELSTYSQKSIFGLLARIRNVGRNLATLDEDSLSMGKWADYKALLADMAAQRFMLEDLELWRSRPTLYVDACVDGIASLYLTAAGRGIPVDAGPRLRMIPTVVRHARRNLRNPTELHCRVASRRIDDLISALENLPADAFSPEIAPELLQESIASLEAFGAFIDSLSLSAATDFALSYDDFLILSDTRNMISDMPEDTRTYARRILDAVNAKLQAHASDSSSGGSHSGGTVAIRDLEAQWGSARDFIEKNALAGFPEATAGDLEDLKFFELPDFMRPLCGDVFYVEPMPDAGSGGGAALWVSREVGEPAATAEGIVASEALPGRHLQAVWSVTEPSPVRRMHTDIFTANGWALYCQELMGEQGFGGDGAARDALLRKRFFAAGTIAAVNVLLGEFTLEAAADFMVDETGVSEPFARRLALQYAMEPELPMSYIIGERQILQIRSEAERISGDDFDLKVFHDSLLGSGRLPLYLVRNNVVSELMGRR